MRKSGDNYYAAYNLGGGWQEYGPYAIADIGASGTIGMFDYKGIAGSCDWDVDWFRRTVAVWDDSPTGQLVDSADTNHTLDAGAGFVLNVSAFAATVTGDVKFRFAKSDVNSWPAAGWSAWKTAAEMNTSAGNGEMDGNRYLFVETQHNSAGTAVATLDDATITYTAVSVGAEKVVAVVVT